MRKILFLFLLIFTLSLFCETQEINCSLNKSEFFLGDEISISFKIDGVQDNYFVEGLPSPKKDYGDFRITDVLKTKEGTSVRIEIKAILFGINPAIFPIDEIKVLKEKSETSYKLKIPPLKVKDRISAKDNPPQIMPPLEMPKNSFLLYYICGIILIILIVLSVFIFSRKKEMPSVEKIKRQESIEEFLTKYFNSLIRKNVLSIDDYKDISYQIRNYLEQKMGMNALEFTTDELMQNLKGQDFISSIPFEKFKRIFEICDLVKFAKYFPEVDEEKEVKGFLDSFLYHLTQSLRKAA